jgi:hypothetical protein
MSKSKTRSGPDPDALRGAVAQIEEHASANLDALIALLEQGRGLRLTFPKARGGTTVAMLGIRVSTVGNARDALQIWARTARRKLLELGA